MRVEINVPDSLREIRLEQYQKFVKLYDGEVTEEFLALKMLEIFCGVKLSDAYNLRYKDVDGVVQILTETLNDKPQLVRTLFMDGVESGFFPILDDMSFREYVELDTQLNEIIEIKEVPMNHPPVTKAEHISNMKDQVKILASRHK